jgi:hypothetical protein
MMQMNFKQKLMKKIKLITLLVLLVNSGISQLKVDQLGHIGMGTNFPNSGYRCHIKGNLLLTSYPSSPYWELQLKTSSTGTIIGSSKDRIDFWTNWTGHNLIAVQATHTLSDSNLKTNINQIENGIEKLMKIRCYKYNLKTDHDSLNQTESTIKSNYGFLSQQIEKELDEVNIVSNSFGMKLMDYNQIIPVAVKAIQEQQLKIEKLKEELQNMKENMQLNGTNRLDNEIISNKEKTTNANVLYQNAPNPFSESTEIKFKLNSDNFESGEILIFDMNGLLINSY